MFVQLVFYGLALKMTAQDKEVKIGWLKDQSDNIRMSASRSSRKNSGFD